MQNQESSPDRRLSRIEVQETYGFSARHFFRRIRPVVPMRKVGGRLQIRQQDIEAFLAERAGEA